MFRKQILMIMGALPAAIVTIGVCMNAARLFSFVALPADDTAERIAFVLRWLLVPGLTLWIGVQFAGRRGFYPELMDGTRTPANHGFEINLRYNTNTLEQVVLAAIAWIGLALTVSPDRLVLIPALAFLFFFGRITFWIGYLIHPLARGFGMVLTALPTACIYIWLVWHYLHG